MNPDEIADWISDDAWEMFCDVQEALDGDTKLLAIVMTPEHLEIHTDAGKTKYFKTHPLRDL